jgi:hypothetical protein
MPMLALMRSGRGGSPLSLLATLLVLSGLFAMIRGLSSTTRDVEQTSQSCEEVDDPLCASEGNGAARRGLTGAGGPCSPPRAHALMLDICAPNSSPLGPCRSADGRTTRARSSYTFRGLIFCPRVRRGAFKSEPQRGCGSGAASLSQSPWTSEATVKQISRWSGGGRWAGARSG